MTREKLLHTVREINYRRQQLGGDFVYGYTGMMVRFIDNGEPSDRYLNWPLLYNYGMHCLPNFGEALGEYADDPYDSICAYAS